MPARLKAWGFDSILCQFDVKAVAAARDQAGAGAVNRLHKALCGSKPLKSTLALHPLACYDSKERLVRDAMKLGVLR